MASSTQETRDHFEQAREHAENVFQCAREMQRRWAELVCEAIVCMNPGQEWGKQSAAILDEAVDASQQSAENSVKLINENAKASLDLLDRTFGNGCSHPDPGPESSVNALGATGFSAMRANLDIIATSNTRLMEAWFKIVKLMNGGTRSPVEQPEHNESRTEVETAA